MNKKLLICLAAVCFITVNVFSQTIPVTITGTLQNGAGKKIYLETFDKATTIKVDSAVIGKKGKYSFKRNIDKKM